MPPTQFPHPKEALDNGNEEDLFLDAADAAEEIPADEDQPMDDLSDDGDDGEEMSFQNDSIAHFDQHNDSIFCIAQHPIHPNIIITGSGDDTAYIFNSNVERPLLPSSYESNPQHKGERESLPVIAKLQGHTDSVNAVAFTEPCGEYVVTAGLDGKLRAWRNTSPGKAGLSWRFLAEVQEVDEINWVATCPVNRAGGNEEKKNLVALGASNGSVWVYRIDAQDEAEPMSMVACYFQHTESCTAGAWTPDGNLLATVGEDACFYVYDVFGAAAGAGVASSAGTQVVVSLTAQDQRFAVEGGLYSIAIAPTGTFAAVGGAEGHIKIVGLPRISSPITAGTTKSKSKSKAAGASVAPVAGGGAGTLLASLQAQTDGIESLSFSSPPLSLLAAGSVDGSVVLFDTAHRYAVRRYIRSAHEDTAVVKVEFVHDQTAAGEQTASAAANNSRSWLLTSVGMDGVVRRWDTRGGTAAAGYGLVKEWRGHLGMAENEAGEQSGGILGFVQGGEGGKRIVTAGDDGVVLVFEE
ncbi:ribosome assembly protein SQT1 [Histoplasma capsulatum var. duboisii H88]|uniref:Ribosome assembly protein SQT1 n=2 Tax=Ajellomyces capsulatus TaxID=5037 RepID=F0UEQ6_AJEC8|nr:ribosome assembly protein SQT1 [Histoplasma capsulatum H143]EGC44786.1 ribosome assembly protein SQT1 [Histoplasma capsulatum var. duboisii H88]QSS55561.1 ribosome assembly protein SQT1 [Histoplasma capsulatum var. duboisii H88]